MTTTTPPGNERYADDDVPHLAVFDRALAANFKWDGNPDHPIEVEPGYSDAPVEAHIPVPQRLHMLDLNGASIRKILAVFHQECVHWYNHSPDSPWKV